MSAEFQSAASGSLVVATKLDIFSATDAKDLEARVRARLPAELRGEAIVCLSNVTGEGVPALLSALEERLAAFVPEEDAVRVVRPRHLHHIAECQRHLADFMRTDAATMDMAAESLRQALRSLARITSHVDSEQLLDIVFSEFCIGK